ncbi:hypothetical protein HID58_076152 [Brassica napus]|uniref:ADP-ribosyl cyclase/cyclic ADP-ribose hydrolase n=1 Tax=Brassica napus TaxID=3708 RepID=A0ABQ7YPY6_BRANA|nr:hypothetical protein HID58_076152 [Brassica napus]
MASSSTPMVNGHPQERPQVFINFRGEELRKNFVSHLEDALKDEDINYFIDTMADPGDEMVNLFNHIEESKVALAVFSERYSESNWCLDELVKIMERVDEKKLRIFPIFFHVKVGDVKYQKGKFGENLRKGEGRDLCNMDKWKKALQSVSRIVGLRLEADSDRTESNFISQVVEKLKTVIALIEREEGTNMVSTSMSSMNSIGNASSGDILQPIAPFPSNGMKEVLKQLEEKIDFKSEETQIVGIVGMPGTGKTALAEMHHQEWQYKFLFNEFFRGFREKSKDDYDWVKNTLLNAQLQRTGNVKIFVVLDDVSDKKQLEFLRTNPGLIKKGSKIVITTRDKGLIADLVEDTYVVPGLNDKEALQLFSHHAFNGQDCDHPPENFIEMSKMFVEYAGGNPLALQELGNELCGENEAHWRRRLETLPHCCNENIGRELRISYDDLTQMQKHAFLDIACFFRSEEEDYVQHLLDTNSGEAGSEVIRDLADKFMINISAGRVDMHNLFCTLGKEIGSSVEKNLGKSRLWNREDAREALVLKKGTVSARGVFLDMSKIGKGIALERKALIKMPNLRYLKIFDSGCPRQCEPVDGKVNLPEGLEFPLKEIRYLHWLKFPLEELPPDFNPENLIDLRLPYSKIKRVWRETKDTPNLKWVDLTHSTNLNDISALSNAISLRRLSLEGCTKLDKLPEGIENMKSLAFLNLRGCTRLLSLPDINNLISLKTLILSDCKMFNEFQVISDNLEYLHLDGTAIKGLPPSIQNLGKLIVLNLKDCNELESLPDCLDKLKALEELILSGCSRLTNFPHVEEIMENLQILLLDGTSIKELPSTLLHSGNNSIDQLALQRIQLRMTGLSLLRRLCLSRNDKISSLQSSISQLYHLKWIDLTYCSNLTSLSTLPPNLRCLDAHGCTSLRTVASPLASLLPSTEQVPSSFIFTNCEKLEHVAMNEIMCYAHNKSRLISDALNRQNKRLALEALVGTCFPGIEVPAWFNHKAFGAVIKPELPRHWSESGFSNCDVGGLSEAGNEQCTVKSTHVFIGFTSWLNINKCREVGLKEGCIPAKASIEFKVTDGTCEAANCEVLKCGFSFVCESDNGSWNANAEATPMIYESNNGALEANAEATPVIVESNTGSSDANVVANPVVEGEIQGGGRFLGLLRRRAWFLNL